MAVYSKHLLLCQRKLLSNAGCASRLEQFMLIVVYTMIVIVCCCVCALLQDEKNQIMTTNVWLEQVRLHPVAYLTGGTGGSCPPPGAAGERALNSTILLWGPVRPPEKN